MSPPPCCVPARAPPRLYNGWWPYRGRRFPEARRIPCEGAGGKRISWRTDCEATTIARADALGDRRRGRRDRRIDSPPRWRSGSGPRRRGGEADLRSPPSDSSPRPTRPTSPRSPPRTTRNSPASEWPTRAGSPDSVAIRCSGSSTAPAPRARAGGGGGHVIPTKETTIHHAEVIGDTGYVLLTRVKDLGHGWEPMFYSLVWRKHDGEWRLLREFVHQKSIPKRL